ncbi:DUF3772 domain-containing protein [Rhodobacterales bacterium HKCCE2091]|nr:DUF3772 domain-containing protein [Rhodobacterales bacterium HKCCE2091]
MTAVAARLAALLTLCLALAVAAPLRAQDTPADPDTGGTAATAIAAVDYEAWDALAGRVEQALDARALATSDFEALRTEVSGYRSRFVAAEREAEARVSTIEGQIEALGPAPEDGSEEPEVVADRRAELAARLAEAQAPQLAAAEAKTRADNLISRIDGLIRERETEALFEAAPTPLNPVNWGAALSSLGAVADEIGSEVRARTAFETRREEIRSILPVTAILGLVGLTLLLRGRHWTLRATEAVVRRSHRVGRLTVSFFVSFTQLVVPILGLVLLTSAVLSVGVLGPVGAGLVSAGVTVIGGIILAAWLAGRLFPTDPETPSPVSLEPESRPAARFLTIAIGAMVGLTQLLETLAGLDAVEPAAQGVFVLPFYLLLSYLFWRLAAVLGRIRQGVEATEEARGLHTRLLLLLVPALRVIAVAGPILAAAGYLQAAERLMVPAALTLGLLGAIQALQVPIRDTYAALSRHSYEDAGQALGPVLINFGLAILSLPIFALIWGVRPAQLGEIYTRFNEGFAFGGARITPGTVISVFIVFLVGLVATRLLQSALRSTVLPRTRMDAGARNALTAGVGYVGIALAAVFAIVAGGIDLTALAFVLSALSVGIGFGLQNVVSNFVSGIILLIERPISEGDWIEVNGQMGIVKDISVRSTRIETFDKTDVIVPNADFISGTVTNWTRGNTVGRAILTVGVAYGTDTRRVHQILHEIAESHPVVAAYPEPGVDFLGFGADSLDFRIRVILRDVNQTLAVQTELNHQIAERFAAEGIEIPFAQRDIWLRNPEALHPRPPVPPPPAQAPRIAEAPTEGPEGQGDDPDGDLT